MPDDAFPQHSGPRHVSPPRHDAQRHRDAFLYGTIVLGAIIFSGLTRAGDAPPAKPAPATTQANKNAPSAQAVRKFHDALKAAQLAEAQKLIATSPQPVRDAERRIKRLSTSLSGGAWDFSILDARESADVAVVLIDDYLKDGRKTIDIKPWYLIRQEGQWKLLGKFTDFELKEYGFDAARIADYRALEKWSQDREPQLRKEQPDCGC
jgi:hypothetical protein